MQCDSAIISSTSSYSRFNIQEYFGQQHGGLAAEVASALSSPGGTQVVDEEEAVEAVAHGVLQGR